MYFQVLISVYQEGLCKANSKCLSFPHDYSVYASANIPSLYASKKEK